MKSWNAQKTTLAGRLADGRRYASGKTIEVVDLPNFLEAVIRPADRVCLEGDNHKQAAVLAAALTDVDPAKLHDLHMVQPGAVLPEHHKLSQHAPPPPPHTSHPPRPPA